MIASPFGHSISLVSYIYCIMVAFDVTKPPAGVKRRFQLSGYLQAQHSPSAVISSLGYSRNILLAITGDIIQGCRRG
jgi:hypothetical protein